MSKLHLQILGQPRNITLRGFTSALEAWLKVLSDIDSAISAEPQGSLEWLVTDLSMGSLTVEVESRSKLPDRNVGPEVTSAHIEGLRLLEHEGASPPYLSETGMQRLSQLVRLVGREGASGFVVTDLDQRVEISARASAQIDQLMRVQQKSIGSVDGKLETISVHGRPRFIVYHSRTRKAVTCRFDPNRWLSVIKEALGSRVNIAGMVHFNAKDEPLRVELEDIRVLRREAELPSIAEISGSDPNLTSNMSTAEYLRSIRGG